MKHEHIDHAGSAKRPIHDIDCSREQVRQGLVRTFCHRYMPPKWIPPRWQSCTNLTAPFTQSPLVALGYLGFFGLRFPLRYTNQENGEMDYSELAMNGGFQVKFKTEDSGQIWMEMWKQLENSGRYLKDGSYFSKMTLKSSR